jgi:hypothetical protein
MPTVLYHPLLVSRMPALRLQQASALVLCAACADSVQAVVLTAVLYCGLQCRAFPRIKQSCAPPFGKEPDCYPYWAPYRLANSEMCVASHSAIYNVTDPGILQQISEVNIKLEGICSGFTAKVWLGLHGLQHRYIATVRQG